MEIVRYPVPRMTLEDFADNHGLVLEVHERAQTVNIGYGPVARYYAFFHGVEVKDGPILSGITGNGDSERDAIRAYAREISNKLLVIDASKPSRREIQSPILSYGGE